MIKKNQEYMLVFKQLFTFLKRAALLFDTKKCAYIEQKSNLNENEHFQSFTLSPKYFNKGNKGIIAEGNRWRFLSWKLRQCKRGFWQKKDFPILTSGAAFFRHNFVLCKSVLFLFCWPNIGAMSFR